MLMKPVFAVCIAIGVSTAAALAVDNEVSTTAPDLTRVRASIKAVITTLLEAILARTGAIQRQGTVEAGSTVGDGGAESRHHRMTVELSVASNNFLGDTYTFIDCPGSIEFFHDMRAALPGVAGFYAAQAEDDKICPR